MTAAILTEGLVKRYPRESSWRTLVRPKEDKVALAGIDLEVRPGEVFGLLGPNGAGKTTLIKILCTLLLPTEGRAFISGHNVVQDNREIRSKLGLVYGDERTFSWRLSLWENLRFYAGLYGLSRSELAERIPALLDLVGLEAGRDGPMHHFSSGMKQRAAIARGLLNDPDVLLMDEPTRSLDPVAAAELRDLIRGRVADGRRTVLLATHLIHEAEALCDRVAVLNKGELELVGSITELREVLRTEDIHQVVVSELNGTVLDKVRHLPGVLSVKTESMKNGSQMIELGVEQGTHALPLVIRTLVEEGGEVWSSSKRELSLEEIFNIALSPDGRGR